MTQDEKDRQLAELVRQCAINQQELAAIKIEAGQVRAKLVSVGTAISNNYLNRVSDDDLEAIEKVRELRDQCIELETEIADDTNKLRQLGMSGLSI